MQQCGALLRKLMNHQFGFLFNQSVKPAALQIPDYFDIISEPMDLGTVKKKLENGSYSSARDFAADVKLTFSNAMKHNPSTNWVHELAGEFSRMFTLEWKSLEAKWSEEEKSDLVYKDQGLMEISKRKLPPKLHGHLRRLGLLCENKDDGETASEIQIFTSVECLKTCEGQLSPSKSLRAAMLKSRFADMILKAQQKTLSTTGDRVDPLKVKQEERERFEKKRREEKARIDAHVKAAKEEVCIEVLATETSLPLALEEEDRIDDLVQEMEASGFWLLDTRQIVANILLKNIELLQSIKLNGNEVDHSVRGHWQLLHITKEA
ncbi:hypothetical protein Scep_027292 [Stephania cephalantha]|uniref:Bromo domain-containing protein n=1 Tax=Stephania cephalantha TaxID=152367 RepID=A0AAP0E7M7_9MAGN